jgi:hypothetical protein
MMSLSSHVPILNRLWILKEPPLPESTLTEKEIEVLKSVGLLRPPISKLERWKLFLKWYVHPVRWVKYQIWKRQPHFT